MNNKLSHLDKILELENYKNNIDKFIHKINYLKEKEKIAIRNYDELIDY